MTTSYPPPDLQSLLAPLLPALPAATVSTKPATAVLPLLSPILRQRVQLLADSSTEPWLRLLCYDPARATKLAEVVRGGGLEPHPVSGEVEVDWDYDAQIRFRRLDRETLQAFVLLESLGLAFQLIYCVNDKDGGGDGWRVGEVTTAEAPSPLLAFGGSSTIQEAEKLFAAGVTVPTSKVSQDGYEDEEMDDEEDDDGGYWDQYDKTPPQTPGKGMPPTPPADGSKANADVDDDYYAQYDHVQPAMDNHDPDEEAQLAQIPQPLDVSASSNNAASKPAVAETQSAAAAANETNGSWTLTGHDGDDEIVHPRPDSSGNSSAGERTVAKLEASADRQVQNEFGIKQHVSRSVRSLYLLSRSAGIEREEFERIVRGELDILSMIEDQD